VLLRSLQHLRFLLAGFLTVVLVLVAWLGIRLAQGPISLTVLKPMVEAQLSEISPEMTVQIGDVILRWEDWDEGINLLLVNASISDTRGKEVARVPELDVDFSSQSLIYRKPLITAIDIIRLDLNLHRRADGTVSIFVTDADEGSENILELFLEDLLTPPDPALPMTYLKRIRFTDARIGFSDENAGKLWDAHVSSGQLSTISGGASVQARALIDAAGTGQPAQLSLSGKIIHASETLDLKIDIERLNPADLAKTTPVLKPLAALDMPVSGTTELQFASDGSVQGMRADLVTDSGHLRVTEELAQQLEQPKLTQSVGVQRAHIVASFAGEAGSYAIETFEINFAEATSVYLPAPVDHQFPISKLNVSARISKDRIEVPGLHLDLGKLAISAQTLLDREGDGVRGDIHLAAGPVNVDDVGSYWPPSLAPGGYTWFTEHLSGGHVDNINLVASVEPSDDGIRLEALNGSMEAEGVRVDYLPPLPAVNNAAAKATFDLNAFTINLSHGTAVGLQVTGGKAILAGFDKSVETLDLDIRVQGPLQGALKLLSSPPLEYTKKVKIDPEQTAGNVETRTRLKFPLLRDLRVEDIDISAEAQLTGGTIKGILDGRDLTDCDLDLKVETTHLTLTGTVAAAGIPGTVKWRENFEQNAAYQSQISFAFNETPVEVLRTAAAKNFNLNPYLLNGALTGRLETTIRNKTQDLVFDADISKTALAIPALGWKKQAGENGNVHLEVKLKDGHPIHIPVIAATSSDLDILAEVGWDEDGDLQHLEITRAFAARNHVSATATRQANQAWDVSVQGLSLDVPPLWQTINAYSDPETANNDLSLKFNALIARVWLGEEHKIDRVKANAVRDGAKWTKINFDGLVGNHHPVRIILTSQPPPGEPAPGRTLSITAADAGATLAALGILSDMRGGKLRLNANYDDTQPGSPLKGKLKVKDYTIVNAPLLARLLNIVSLTGIADALRGDGISFSTLDAPFTWHEERLELENAKAHGPSIGITASGSVAARSDQIGIKGTVVPFYIVNSLLGRIPLVGGLFTGGEKGGGVFAASYTIVGSLEDPQISVNPLSVLAPGVTRRIFSIFDQPMPEDGTKPQAAPPAEDNPLSIDEDDDS